MQNLPALLAFALCLTGTSAASANMAKPWDDGDVVGEPTGAQASVRILEEDLSFDLRPLSEGQPARIEALYKLHNEGEPAEVELFFVAPGLEEGSVLVNGASVESQKVERELPEAWRSNYSARYKGAGFLFKAPLSAGANKIEVRYSALAARDHPSSEVHVDYLISYVLAPARQWASFGELKVSVQIPEGWSMTSTPPLEGERVSFEGLPADAFEIVLSPPTGIRHVALAMLPLGLLLGLALAFFIGRFSRGWRPTASRGEAVLNGLGIGLVAGPLAGLLAFGVSFLGQWIPHSAYISRSWSYETMLQSLVLSVLLGVVAIFVCLVGRGRAWEVGASSD